MAQGTFFGSLGLTHVALQSAAPRPDPCHGVFIERPRVEGYQRRTGVLGGSGRRDGCPIEGHGQIGVDVHRLLVLMLVLMLVLLVLLLLVLLLLLLLLLLDNDVGDEAGSGDVESELGQGELLREEVGEASGSLLLNKVGGAHLCLGRERGAYLLLE